MKKKSENLKKRKSKKKDKRWKITKSFDKISLNDEGVLLQCIKSFEGDPQKTDKIDGGGRAVYMFPSVEEDEIVLYLGCWHFEYMPKKWNPEMETPVWITYLKFLHGQRIVKIKWFGINKFAQLFQAAKFIYSHFQLAKK